MNTVQAIFSLGSNIEPRQQFIEQALAALKQLPGVYQVRSSSLHETVPVDVPAGEQHLLFLNGIAVCDTSLSPESLSEAIHHIEATLGRQRSGHYGVARTIDIDIIAMGNTVMNTPALTLPHPRAHQRTFVLAPLAELLPTYRLPGQEHTVTDLLNALLAQK